MNNKEVMWKVFDKYKRMKRIMKYYKEMPPYEHQRLTQAFKDVVVQSSRGVDNPIDKAIIKEDDARYYMALIDKAIDMLDDTDQRPYKRIIKWRYIEEPHYSMNKIAILIGYSVESYKIKLREAQEQLVEILDLWAVNY